MSDADGKVTTLGHDAQGHRTSITRSGARTWTYNYNLDGEVREKADPDGRVTTYGYDERDNELFELTTSLGSPSATNPAATGIDEVSLIYDGPPAAGSSADLAPSQRSYSYLNRGERLANAIFYHRATSGAPWSITAMVAYGYDPQGHVVHEDWTLEHPQTGTKVFQLARSFNALGKPSTATYTNIAKTASWVYDGRGAISTVSVADGTGASQLARYQYATSGHIRNRFGLADGSGPRENHADTYDHRGRLLSDFLSVNEYHVNRRYTYTDDGDLKTLTFDDRVSGAPQKGVMSFTYDGLHRLKTATTSGSPAYSANLDYSWAGRIQIAAVSGAGNVPDRSVGYLYAEDGMAADVQAVRALTVQGQPDLADFTYDKAGNLATRTFPVDPNPLDLRPNLSAQNAQYEHNVDDQVARVTMPSTGAQETYFYDQGHRRFLELASDGTWRFQIGGGEYEYEHHLDHDQAAAYIGGAGEAIARLTDCVVPASVSCQSLSPEVVLLHHDRRGDLVASFSQNGIPQSHFIYGAFGERLSTFDAQSDWRRRFNGKEEDQIDRLTYYGYRYYDPLTLQWTNADPLVRFAPEVGTASPQMQNVYAFSVNNPVRFVDKNGLLAPDPASNTGSQLLIRQFGPNIWGYPSLSGPDTVTTAGSSYALKLGLHGRYRTMFAQAYWSMDPHYKSWAESVMDSKGPGMSEVTAAVSILRAMQTLEGMLQVAWASVTNWTTADQTAAAALFGSSSAATRQTLQDRVWNEINVLSSLTLDNFAPEAAIRVAGVYAPDPTHTIHLGTGYGDEAGWADIEDRGINSRPGTIAHELSHFLDIGGTSDVPGYRYTIADSLRLTPSQRLKNADNFEFWLETR